MKQITRDAVEAFINNIAFSSSNTSVSVHETGVAMLLHGNIIAIKTLKSGKIKINNCGWETPTTKERLNGILELCGSSNTTKIYTKNGTWYWKKNGKVVKFPYSGHTRIN